MYRTHLFVFALIISLSCCAAQAGDWPQFRGPAGQGHSEAKGLPATWSESENVAWKTKLPGKGFSSPVILGGRVWVTAAIEKPETPEKLAQRLKANTGGQPLDLAAEATFYAIGLDQATGKIMEEITLFTEIEPQWVHRMNSYASPTPVAEPGRLYSHFGTYGTVALDTKSGKVLWKNQDHRIMHENGPGGSPVLYENLLIFHCDGSDLQYLAALDKSSGKTVWKTDRSGKMNPNPQLKKAYGTPLMVSIEGKDVLVSPAADWLYGYDPLTGRELWKVGYETLGFSIVPRPVTGNGMIYFSTSFMQSELQAVRYDGTDGKREPHLAWREKKSVPKMSSPLVVGKELYMVSDDGGVLTCLDALDGKLIYRERIDGKHCASPLYADGKIYLCDRDGTTVVIKPGRSFEVLARNKLALGMMASPAAVDSALYLRTEEALYRIEAKK